jgi:Na+-transporting NADH:ubiquinone oxidoreductase subunit B
MTRWLQSLFERAHPLVSKDSKFHWAWPLLEAQETFLLTPDHKTAKGAHVRDPMDMKRLMIFVIYAMVPCILIGMWNVGYQAYLGEGVASPSVVSSLLRGAWHMLPIIVVSYAVGGAWELLFSVVRRHEINEGFLVTGMLFPLTLAPETPLWIVAAGVSFGVVIGKEVFGGVGMNVLNPALTARAFVFFAYPKVISGAFVWDVVGQGNPITGAAGPAVDGYTGATALLAVASAPNGSSAIEVLNAEGFTWWDLFVGAVPGSMGEVSALGALIGAAALIITGIASWRIIAGTLIGLLGTATFVWVVLGGGLTGPSPDTLAFFTVPPHYHLVMGGFAFGAAFMATDPVSGAATNAGRWAYGILIGALCVVIRVFNPAYPEGMMLAILFMNVFAPLLDYVALSGGKRRRAARLAAA